MQGDTPAAHECPHDIQLHQLGCWLGGSPGELPLNLGFEDDPVARISKIV